MRFFKTGLAILCGLVLTATGLWAAGADEEGSAAAAEKQYVTDPSTGKQVLKPAYGGTITVAQRPLGFDHADTWISHAGGVYAGAALDKLGQADWAVDRSVNKMVTYYPESVVTDHLAESWENPDPLTYIYKIRDNVFFHDKPPVNGRQLTADDVAANYERLFGIGRFAGQEPAVHTWGTKALPFESVTATDKLTLVIKLSRPAADTHRQLFDDCHVRAYPPETFDMLGNVNNLIGTGPFMVNEYVTGTSITWDRNPNYWKDDEKYPGNRLPYADKLVMLMMSDEATILAALRSGQIDIAGATGNVLIKSIANAVQLQKDVPGTQLFPIARRSETSLGMRMDKPPLNDIRVRHALQMALDLETVRDNYFLGFGEWQPMGSIGPAVIGYNNPFDTWPEELKKFWSYDPAGAERLLDEAGYPRGADGVRFQTSILIRGDRSDVGYMELVAGYWKEIGVEAEIEAVDTATYERRRQALDFDGLKDFWAVGADYGDLNSTLGQFRDDSSYRAGTFSDPVFEAKYDELQAAAGDAEEHRRLAKALDMYVIEQHPYIYGPRVATFNVAQPWIVGYNGEMAIGNCAWNGPYARMWNDSQLKAELN